MLEDENCSRDLQEILFSENGLELKNFNKNNNFRKSSIQELDDIDNFEEIDKTANSTIKFKKEKFDSNRLNEIPRNSRKTTKN
jgi:hypothetical protein